MQLSALFKMSKQSHIERTANEPRDSSLHTLTIADITQISPTIRLFRLGIPPNHSIQFLPGQWVDLYPPPHADVPKPGGFTITSSPSLAVAQPCPSNNPNTPPPPPPSAAAAAAAAGAPYIELAIQSSPQNPAAAYLFRPAAQLLHTTVQVRIGGSFVFPPPSHSGSAKPLRKVVLVAGGMGINPLMSMLSFMGERGREREREWTPVGECEVRVLYGVKDPGLDLSEGGMGREHRGEVLFLDRIVGLFERGRVRGGLRLFVTAGGGPSSSNDEGGGDKEERVSLVRCNGVDVPVLSRRMAVKDVQEAVGDDKEAAVVYVCGVPAMTDEFVQALVSPEGFGMEEGRVLFEKWW